MLEIRAKHACCRIETDKRLQEMNLFHVRINVIRQQERKLLDVLAELLRFAFLSKQGALPNEDGVGVCEVGVVHFPLAVARHRILYVAYLVEAYASEVVQLAECQRLRCLRVVVPLAVSVERFVEPCYGASMADELAGPVGVFVAHALWEVEAVLSYKFG